jgi:hypothetical protein
VKSRLCDAVRAGHFAGFGGVKNATKTAEFESRSPRFPGPELQTFKDRF